MTYYFKYSGAELTEDLLNEILSFSFKDDPKWLANFIINDMRGIAKRYGIGDKKDAYNPHAFDIFQGFLWNLALRACYKKHINRECLRNIVEIYCQEKVRIDREKLDANK